MSTTHTDDRQAESAGFAGLSRSIAHLDIAALAGITAVAAGAAVLKPRVNLRRGHVAGALAVFASLGALILRLGRRSGVTREELRSPLPGDDLIPHSYAVTDRAITVSAPLEQVWPWVVQMGYHRGGWYTSPWLDKIIWHIDNSSENRIVPEYQDVHVGDIIPDGEPGKAHFMVAAIEKNRHILYLDDTGSHVPGIEFTWAFVLRPLADGSTRIQVRWRNGPIASAVMRVIVRLLVAPADFVMMNQLLGGIKRRSERAQRSRTGTSILRGAHESVTVNEEEVNTRSAQASAERSTSEPASLSSPRRNGASR